MKLLIYQFLLSLFSVRAIYFVVHSIKFKMMQINHGLKNLKIPEMSGEQFISHSPKCYAAGCVQVCCRGLMGSRKACILPSMVDGLNSLILCSSFCVSSYHQTSKAIQPLVLVASVLLKLLLSVVAHCHLKSQTCTFVLNFKFLWHVLYMCCYFFHLLLSQISYTNSLVAELIGSTSVTTEDMNSTTLFI